MQALKEQVTQLSDFQKVHLFEFLRDDLGLKTTTEMARKYGKSYGGLIGLSRERLTTTVAKTLYYVDRD